MQAYSQPERESDPHALPDLDIFQLTAEEVASSYLYEEEQHEYLKRHEFRLATMNGQMCGRMLDTMIEELGITGGWFYQYCFPGCMPDSDPIGPFATAADAEAAAQDGVQS